MAARRAAGFFRCGQCLLRMRLCPWCPENSDRGPPALRELPGVAAPAPRRRKPRSAWGTVMTAPPWSCCSPAAGVLTPPGQGWPRRHQGPPHAAGARAAPPEAQVGSPLLLLIPGPTSCQPHLAPQKVFWVTAIMKTLKLYLAPSFHQTHQSTQPPTSHSIHPSILHL